MKWYAFFPRYIGEEMVEFIFSSTNVSTLSSPGGPGMWREFQFFKQPAGCYLINTWAWIHHWIISWALKTLLHYCGTYLLTCNLSLVAPRRLGVSFSFRRATHHFTYCIRRSASRAACSFCEIKHISFHSYFISWIAILFVLCEGIMWEIYLTRFEGTSVHREPSSDFQLITSIRRS